MTHIWTDALPNRPVQEKRWTTRSTVEVPARLTWKDHRGTARFASVLVRNASEFGVYVESRSPLSLPLFRLVHLQLERAATAGEFLPEALRQGGRVLSAVYRVSPPSPSARQGFALRLMIDPRRVAPAAVVNRATA